MMLPIVEIYDGDTIKTDLSWRLPEPLNKVSIRLYGIDTPELPAKSYYETGKLGRADCVKEAELALAAKAAVAELAAGHTKMKVFDFEWDKYGGRILASVKIGGVDIAKFLIEHGFAVEYYGTGTKKDWCE
jgi:endonuclease YncB( thermonuclease family)